MMNCIVYGRSILTGILIFLFFQSQSQVPLASLERPERKIEESKSDRQVIINFTDWVDTDGNYISAHAGDLFLDGDTYYWYGGDMGINPHGMFNERVYIPGEDPATWQRFFDGYNCYSSKDLKNWKFEGKAMEAPEKGFMSLYITGRPHVIFNEKSQKYILYHYYYPIYPGCLLMVAQADSPTGPFEHVAVVEAGSSNGHVGDMNVFKDPEGNAYVIYDNTGFDILIDKLTDDYLNSEKQGIKLLDRKHESPAMVYYKGKYILATSGVDGFGATETTVAWSDNPMGPFRDKQVVSKDHSWGSQITDMIVVPEHDYILMLFDQWFTPDRKNIDRSRYLLLPMTFDIETGKATLHFMKEWDPENPFSGE